MKYVALALLAIIAAGVTYLSVVTYLDRRELAAVARQLEVAAARAAREQTSVATAPPVPPSPRVQRPQLLPGYDGREPLDGGLVCVGGRTVRTRVKDGQQSFDTVTEKGLPVPCVTAAPLH